MKYFVLLFAIAAWGSLGLIIGKGVVGTWREESNADKKARILNDSPPVSRRVKIIMALKAPGLLSILPGKGTFIPKIPPIIVGIAKQGICILSRR